jgi:hypothetical protein
MFPDDADALRATARRLRALAAGCFEWRDRGSAHSTQTTATHDDEARQQMLAIAAGFDRLAACAEERARADLHEPRRATGRRWSAFARRAMASAQSREAS